MLAKIELEHIEGSATGSRWKVVDILNSAGQHMPKPAPHSNLPALVAVIAWLQLRDPGRQGSRQLPRNENQRNLINKVATLKREGQDKNPWFEKSFPGLFEKSIDTVGGKHAFAAWQHPCTEPITLWIASRR